jgi:hypothetical protein
VLSMYFYWSNWWAVQDSNPRPPACKEAKERIINNLWRVRQVATTYDELPQMPCPARLSRGAVTADRNWEGLVVGTILGTVSEKG